MDVDHTQYSDQELVVQALFDPEAFSQIIERYQDKLLRYIMRISNVSVQDAEDILQETFIKAYSNLNDYDHSLQFSSWIYRIAHNQTISSYRKRSVRPHGNSIEVDDVFINNIASDIDLDKDIEQSQLKELLQGAIQQLDIKYRDVLVLRYFQDRSYQEISDIIQKPSGTVATLLNRAKKKMQKIIEQQGNLDI